MTTAPISTCPICGATFPHIGEDQELACIVAELQERIKDKQAAIERYKECMKWAITKQGKLFWKGGIANESADIKVYRSQLRELQVMMGEQGEEKPGAQAVLSKRGVRTRGSSDKKPRQKRVTDHLHHD